MSDIAGNENLGVGDAPANPGATGGGRIFLDPGTIGNPDPDGTADAPGGGLEPGGPGGGGGKRKRGRPPGSGRKPGAEREAAPQADVNRAPLSIDGVSAILLSIHTMAESFFSVPELGIDTKEADRLASAIKGVADQYDVKPSEKSLAWTNLATAAAMVYGTRMFAFKVRKDMERAEKKNQPPTNVVGIAR